MNKEDFIEKFRSSNIIEDQINIIIDFYYDNEAKLLIAELNNESEINIISIAKEYLKCADIKQGLKRFDHVFFNIVSEINDINIKELFDVFNGFNSVLGVDFYRNHMLDKICSAKEYYATYIFKKIKEDLNKYKEIFSIGVSSLSIFNSKFVIDFVENNITMLENIWIINYIKYIKLKDLEDAKKVIKILVLFSDIKYSDYFSEIFLNFIFIENKFNFFENEIFSFLNILEENNKFDLVAQTSSWLILSSKKELSTEREKLLISIIKKSEKVDFNVASNLGSVLYDVQDEDKFKIYIECIEYLIGKFDELEIGSFGIYFNNGIFLNKLITYWMMSESIKINESAASLLLEGNIDNFDFDSDWLDELDLAKYLLLMKRFIAYLYYKTDLLCKISVSILNKIEDVLMFGKIIKFIFDNFLINYDYKHLEYFFNEEEHNENNRVYIHKLKEKHRKFYEDMDSTRKIKELQCPVQNFISMARKRHKENEEINRKAHEKSIFASIFNQQLMLYGDTSIFMLETVNNEDSIQETPLGSYSYSLPLPIEHFVNPVYFEYKQKILLFSKDKE